MRRYSVHISFQTHWLHTERATRTYAVSAPNKDVAILAAGRLLGMEETPIVVDSAVIHVTKI